jgi:hypothetical protein
MSVKVAPLSEAIAAPGPVAPVALSQRVEARHRHGGNDDARHHAAAPPAEQLPEARDDACHTDWADRRAGLREQNTEMAVAVAVALPNVAVNLARLPSIGAASAQATAQHPAPSAATAGGETAAPGGATGERPQPAVAVQVPVNPPGNTRPAAPGTGGAPPSGLPLPSTGSVVPFLPSTGSVAPSLATPAADPSPAAQSAAAMLARAATAPASITPGVMPGAIHGALSHRGSADTIAASTLYPISPAAPVSEVMQSTAGDVATAQPTTPVVAAVPAGVDTPAQQQSGGESLLTAARAEANVTTRKIVHAAQQATMLQATMAARTQPASQVNVAFRSWGIDASGSAHSVRVRLQDGQAIVQPSTARVGQALALALAELPRGVDLQTAVEQASNATDERRRRRGQQPSP